MKEVYWDGKWLKVIDEQVGRVQVHDVEGRYKFWLLKTDDVQIIEQKSGGRPRKHESAAEKQRAYRERKKGDKLRGYRNGLAKHDH